jgi:hypothetical protein
MSPNCGPLTVFQSLNVIVRPAHGFEFDMPALNYSVLYFKTFASFSINFINILLAAFAPEDLINFTGA